MTPQLTQFVQQVAAMAAQVSGSPPILIIVRDPHDRTVSFWGTHGALDNMKPEIQAKVAVKNGEDVDTAWET